MRPREWRVARHKCLVMTVISDAVGQVERTPDYEDLALWEILTDPVLFQMFLLPDPASTAPLADYIWNDDEHARDVWYYQYYFLLWPMVLCEAGRAIGKTTVGLQGATAFDMINYPNQETGVLGPTDQHAMRVYNEVVALLLDHPFFKWWMQEDPRKPGVRQSKREIKAKNGWGLRALIPGRGGIGYKGEHPRRARGDEVQDIPDKGWTFLVDLIIPFDPKDRDACWQYYGVPDGNRTTKYAEMCHNKAGRWYRWKRRIPSFLSAKVTQESFLGVLEENGCTYYRTKSGRIVVTQYSNDGKRNTLGQWGDPVAACFPLRVYEACTVEPEISDYSVVELNPQVVAQTGIPAEDLLLQLLMQQSSRPTLAYPVERVFVAVDPGPAFCAVTVWGKLAKKHPHHTAEWYLLQRLDFVELMDTTLLTVLVDRVAGFWEAEWIGADSTSQSVYVADWLMNKDLFAFHGRRRLQLRGLTKGDEIAEEIARTKGWEGQVVIPVDFAGTMPSMFVGPEPEMENTDIFTVRVLQMLMTEDNPRLLLPSQGQDRALFAEVTSYRETLTGGKRFEPPHPHIVSTFKVFAAMIHYAELLDIPPIRGGQVGYAGMLPRGTNILPSLTPEA